MQCKLRECAGRQTIAPGTSAASVRRDLSIVFVYLCGNWARHVDSGRLWPMHRIVSTWTFVRALKSWSAVKFSPDGSMPNAFLHAIRPICCAIPSGTPFWKPSNIKKSRNDGRRSSKSPRPALTHQIRLSVHAGDLFTDSVYYPCLLFPFFFPSHDVMHCTYREINIIYNGNNPSLLEGWAWPGKNNSTPTVVAVSWVADVNHLAGTQSVVGHRRRCCNSKR